MSFLPVLIALDANQDGEISASEIKNAAAALKTLDKNKDGKCSFEEFKTLWTCTPGLGGYKEKSLALKGRQRAH